MLIKVKSPDVGEELSREIQYQSLRGRKAVRIELSPEVMESMRLRLKQPSGAMLVEHDGLPVSVNRKFIGLNAWRVIYDQPAPPTERQIDLGRAS